MLESVLNFFITSAHADGILPAPGQGGGFSFVTMFVIFFLFVYFAIWRPQNKRAKEQQTMMSSLAKGDEVVTAGGLIGRISKMTDQYIGLAVANNVEIILQKSSIVSILPKGTLKAVE